jgi:hypothetical protein
MPKRLLARIIALANDKEIVEPSDSDILTLFSSDSDEIRRTAGLPQRSIPRTGGARPWRRSKSKLREYCVFSCAARPPNPADLPDM